MKIEQTLVNEMALKVKSSIQNESSHSTEIVPDIHRFGSATTTTAQTKIFLLRNYY